MSLVTAYDDLIRCTKVLTEGGCEPEFIKFVLNQEECRKKWLSVIDECQRLRLEVERATEVKDDLERKLVMARRLLDLEVKKRYKVEEERDSLVKQIDLVRDVLFVEKQTNDETREKLAFLNNTQSYTHKSLGRFDVIDKGDTQRLNTINEDLNSTESLLSDLSYSRSEDDLDVEVVRTMRTWKKHRPSLTSDELGDPMAKRRRTSTNRTVEISNIEAGHDQQIIATTTLSVPRDGPMTASSKIETIPSETKSAFATPNVPPLITPSAPPKPKNISSDTEDSICETPKSRTSLYSGLPTGGFNFGADKMLNRPHTLCTKTMIKPETCEPCSKKIKFGKVALRCQNCRALCHLRCKDKLPLPCVPHTPHTPTGKGVIGSIADFAPSDPPMIPALILHCVKEVEARGLNEVGLYRVPGSEKDVKSLKEKFLRSRGVPNLSAIEIPVLCGVIKDFLRSLKEPLVTHALWPDFVRTVDIKDLAERNSALFQVISELPRPNRDTLAYMILHLQKVSECTECKMPASNLGKVFGPTLIGYSCMEPDRLALVEESRKIVQVVESLMSLPSEYWARFVTENSTPVIHQSTGQIISTPSSTSLNWYRSGSATRKFFNTPNDSSSSVLKGRRFFSSVSSGKQQN